MHRNLSSPPAYRQAWAQYGQGLEVAREMRHLDTNEDPIGGLDPMHTERAILRLDENRKVRALAWTAHKRAHGILTD